MGNLFFINKSLEFNNIPVAERDLKFINFCKAINLSKIDKDGLYATHDIFTIQFSYGNVFFDLFYKSWTEINSNPHLSGISNTAHALFESLMFAVPGMISCVNSHEEFLELFSNYHYGNTGIELEENIHNPFICCETTWHLWKSSWFARNQNLIDWDNADNNFLPNRKISDKFLINEIIKHNKEKEFINKHKNNVGLAFHDEVMRIKGNEIEAYTIEVGKKVAELNYYKFEDELSKAEQLKAGSLRNIYSIITNNGTLQYISLDHLHGMFEFHNHKGEHKGEFKFDGSYNSKGEVDHNFKTI